LPKNMPSPPIFYKTNPADTPILLIAVTSDTLPLTKVDDYAESILAQKISQMPGVALVGIGGQQKPAIRVQVNPAILAAEGLDLEQLRSALAAITVIQPKGQLYGQQQSYMLNTNDQIETAEGFNDQIIAFRSGAPVGVRDIGRAVVGPEDITSEAGTMTSRRSSWPFSASLAQTSSTPSIISRRHSLNRWRHFHQPST
jgi:multidrug efflux pump subunit AcrB